MDNDLRMRRDAEDGTLRETSGGADEGGGDLRETRGGVNDAAAGGEAGKSPQRRKRMTGAESQVRPGARPRGDAGGGRSRIAQTARRLQAEAANILAGDRPPRMLPEASAAAYAVLPPAVETGLGEEEISMLGEVTDAAGRLLLCMPPDQALRRGLRLRLCAVALRTGDGKVILHKGTRPGAAPATAKPRSSRNRPGRSGKGADPSLPWDIYTGHVPAGEAWDSTALRLLETRAGAAGSRLVRLAEIDGEAAGGAHIRYYSATLVSGLYPKHAPEDTLEADRDELAGLAENVPELLSPLLLQAVLMGILFPTNGRELIRKYVERESKTRK
ncbi:MAG: hypothetical protein LBR82_08770 [Desulfovibrio sp.]|nr:hypothetical protein [Desulfovibrio sp.]